ncbi:MAG: hypothetical protein ACFCU4_11885 [Puniceicoccaceae bacterium]
MDLNVGGETGVQQWQDKLEDFLELIYGLPFGEVSFWINFSVSVFATLVFGWFVCNLLLSGKAGLISTLIAFVLIFLGGAAAHIAIELYVLESVANETAKEFLPWIGLGLGIFVVTLTLGRLVLGLSEGKALLGVILTLAAASVCVYLTSELALRTEESLEETGKQIDERNRELQSID